MASITGIYQKTGQATPTSMEAPSSVGKEQKGKSFADVLFVEPAKNAVDAAKSAESAAILSTTGEIDELTVAELINEADLALQEFKTVWEKTLQALNELPRVSM